MKKFYPLIIVIIVIISYIGCSNTSNIVSPTNVTFKVTHLKNLTNDTVFFFANPSEDVRVSFIKGTIPSGLSDSGSNLNFSWSKNSVNDFAFYSPADSGVYRFFFKGTFTSGGTSFTSTANDTIH